MQGHISQLECGKHFNPILSHAWEKHDGAEAFEFFILERVESPAKLIEREQNWIDYYSHLYSFESLFNICPIADRKNPSKEQIARLVQRVKGLWTGNKNPWFGSSRSGSSNPFHAQKHTEETKRLIGEKASIRCKEKPNPFLGKKHTPELRARLSELAKQRVMSEETKRKLSRLSKGRRDSKQSLPVKQLTLDGAIVHIWSAASEAMATIGINCSSIGRVAGKKLLKRHRCLSAGGFKWEFATQDEFEKYHSRSLKEYCDEQTKINKSKLGIL